MFDKIKFALGATLVAVSQLAAADQAEVTVSNIALSVSGPGWWYWLPTNVDWRPESAGTAVQLDNPRFANISSVWTGQSTSSSMTDGASSALASLTPKTPGDLPGTAAQAKVDVSGGQSGWAFANVVNNQILVAGLSTLSVSMKLDSIQTSGAMSQANATIQLCSIDFKADPTDTCLPTHYVEAVSMGGSVYGGPSILTTTWTNTSADAIYARIQIGLTAAATSVAAVPEPASAALWLAGMAGIAVYRRRRAS